MPFARNPAAANAGKTLDFEKKAHVIFYEKATKSLFEDPDDRFNLEPEHTQNFLDRLYSRAKEVRNSVIDIPLGLDPDDNSSFDLKTAVRKNLCLHHGEFDRDYLLRWVQFYIGEETRARMSQDDQIMALSLERSLTEKAFLTIQADKEAFTVQGEVSGILLLKAILVESAVDSSVDPEVIRIELSQAYNKFAETNYNVKQFNDWIKLKVNQLQQKGAKSTDLLAHLFTAYQTAPDDEFLAYISRMRDEIRDGSLKLNYLQLMRRANDKMDAIEKAAIISQTGRTSTKDTINALQAKIAALEKKANKKPKGGRGKKGGGGGDKGGGGGGGGKSKKDKKDKGKKNDKKSFPSELHDKAAPSDHTKPLKIDGVEYYYCFTHKWCKHSTPNCKMPNEQHKQKHPHSKGSSTTSSTSSSASGSDGSRQGRAVSAFNAAVAGKEEE